MTDYIDDTYKLGRVSGRLRLNKSEYGNWYDGCVVTNFGMVSVFSQGYEDNSKSHKHTVMQYATNGSLHIRRWDNAFGKSYLATLANRFAEDITIQHYHTNKNKNKGKQKCKPRNTTRQ